MKTESATSTLETTVASLANKATYTGAGITISGGMMLSEIPLIFGMIFDVLGLLLNWYYKEKEYKNTTAEHKRRMKDLE